MTPDLADKNLPDSASVDPLASAFWPCCAAIALFVTVFILAQMTLRGSNSGPNATPAIHAAAAGKLSPSQVFDLASPSVVQIVCFDRKGVAISIGSGFIIDSDGSIATNFHVIEKACAANVVVKWQRHAMPEAQYLLGRIEAEGNFDEREQMLPLPVKGVVAEDRTADLAVISVSKIISEIPALRLSDTELPAIGSKVYAIGNPSGLSNTLSDGLVSGHRVIESVSVIQATAPVGPGSSGGPLMDEFGKVVGITSFGYKSGQNLNFAVSSDRLSALYASRGAIHELPGVNRRHYDVEPGAVERPTQPPKPTPESAVAQRKARNYRRMAVVYEVIREVDNEVPPYARDDWRWMTLMFREKTYPGNAARDQLVDLINQFEKNESVRLKSLEAGAFKAIMSVTNYCNRFGFPQPVDYNLGTWGRLRSALRELESP